jgi:hypothetical protein
MGAWKIGQAKQRLSEVVRRAAEEPQIIQNRDHVVAAVIGPEEVGPFLKWRESQRGGGLSAALDEVQAICADEAYELPVAKRVDRSTPFERRPRVPHRHQRPQ